MRRSVPALVVPVGAGTLFLAAASFAWTPALEAPAGAPLEDEAIGLVADHGCYACHEGLSSEQRAALDERRPPRLAANQQVGERVNGAWLQAFLEDPRGTRAATTHPHQLAGLEATERARVAADLVAFLTADASPDSRPTPSSSAELERGRQLFHTVGCVACHVPEEAFEDLEWTLADWNRFEEEAPDEGKPVEEPADEGEAFVPEGTLEPGDQPIPEDLAQKYSVASLARFLSDPLNVRPSGHMPHMGLGSGEARAIATYLLREQVQGGGARFEERPGLLLIAETLEPGSNPNAQRPEQLPKAIRSERHVVDVIDVSKKPQDNLFVLRFQGIVTVPEDGEYTFHLSSDDGSWLDIDGKRLINNGGVHAPRKRSGKARLIAGPHPISIVMFENAGGESVNLTWSGPGVEDGPIPPDRFSHWELDFPGLAASDTEGDASRGAAAFVGLGCAKCHTDVAANTFAVNLTQPARCLGEPGSDTPSRFALDAGRLLEGSTSFAHSDWIASIEARIATPAAHVDHLLERRSCLQCHRRDEIGGVHPERRPFFQGDPEAELGDEARYPPHLSGVGRKLNDGALERALSGEEQARPYLYTRMPRYGMNNVGGLVDLFASADRVTGEPEEPTALPAMAINNGRKLAGIVNGLGCVQCHDFLGNRSLGVRAVDLGKMHTRIRWPWFRDLLLDPDSVGMNSRMTSVFIEGESPVKDVCGGDPEQQAAALWAFLAEEDQMAPPPGLNTGDAAYEIAPLDDVRMVGVFMKDVSARVLCVGTPEGVHFAWDMETQSLAKVWRGRFMNLRGTWEGRAGKLELPPTKDVVGLPLVPAGAVFGPEQRANADPWPAGGATPRYRRQIDDRSWEFAYDLDGASVRESIAILTPTDGTDAAPTFLRMVSVRTANRQDVPRVLVARGTSIVAEKRHVYRVEGDEPFRVVLSESGDPLSRDPNSLDPGYRVEIVDVEGAQELRAWSAGPATQCDVTWTIQW